MKLCFLIFPLLLATALCSEDCDFTCSNKLLLFAIRAGSGYSALGEFNNRKRKDTLSMPEKIPDVFRSKALNNLADVIEGMSFNRIVVEMRTSDKPVAWAKFDVSFDTFTLHMHYWFVVERLVESYPYWVGKDEENFVDFSIKGYKNTYTHSSNGGLYSYSRSFYIHHNNGGCDVDSGLMGVGETPDKDMCSWVSNGGRAPVLFYAASKAIYCKGNCVNDNSRPSIQQPGTVRYAEQLLIYLSME